MHRHFFLPLITFIAIFWYSLQAFASSSEDISLLTGQRKTQPLTNSSEKPEMVLGPNIEKYMKYCAEYNQSCNLAEMLWQLEQYKHKWNSFKMLSRDFKIPDQFIEGMFEDFQNPSIGDFVETISKQSNDRKGKEDEGAESTVNKPSMDITSLSSANFSDDLVNRSKTPEIKTPETGATTLNSKLRYRGKTEKSPTTPPPISSH